MTINYPIVNPDEDILAIDFNTLRKDVIRNAGDYGVTGGSANAQTLTIDSSIGLADLVDGFKVRFKAGFTTTTSTPTLDVNGTGALVMTDREGLPLVLGGLQLNGLYEATKDGSNWKVTNFIERPNFRTTIYGLNSYGDNTTQYDITNPSGDTYRYTYDGTGTNPFIGTNSMIIGQTLDIVSDVFNPANTGTFVITNVGANFFEVQNPNGVAENDVTRGTGRIGSPNSYSIPNNLSKLRVELWAGGGGGGGGGYGGGNSGRSGGAGGGGAYFERLYDKNELSSPVSFTVGIGGLGGSAGLLPSTNATAGANGGNTVLTGLFTVYGGAGGNLGASNDFDDSFNGGGGGGLFSAGSGTTGGDGEQGSRAIYGGGNGATASLAAERGIFGGGGGRGRTASANSSVYGGAGGGVGARSSGKSPGGGGTSFYGGNGGNGGTLASGTTAGQAGQNGLIRGGGGGGGSGGNYGGSGGGPSSGSAGGNGGAGLIRFTEYFIN